MKRSLLLLAGVAAIAAAQQARLFYRDANNTILIYLTEGSLSTEENRIEFSGSGSPMSIELRESGAVLSGNRATGVVVRSEPRDRLERAEVTGNARLTSDSQIADQALAERAVRLGQPAPAPSRERTTSELNTTRFTFSHAEGQELGTLSVPEAFTLASTTTGRATVRQGQQDVEVNFTQVINVTGSSGTFAVHPNAPREVIPLRTGSIEGPIDFKLTRTETPTAGGPASVTTITGVAQRLEIDLSQPQGTLTAIGDVRLTGDTAAFSGTANGARAVVTLDAANKKPVRIQLFGSPTTSTFRDKSTGGGGR